MSAIDHVEQNPTSNGLEILDGTKEITHSDGIPIVLEASPSTNGKSAVKHLPPEFYSPFISEESKRRKPNPIRGLFPLEHRPGVISLLAGKPNPASFPITSLQLTVRAPPDPSLPSDESKEIPLEISGDALAEGLQYGATAGYAPLLEWLRGLQEHLHGRKKGEGWRVTMGAGSQDLLYKAVHALVNPGDPVLVESPVYSGIINLLDDELKADVIVIETDAHGIKSPSLRSILDNWPSSKPLPKVLYTVPFGNNPSGTTTTNERRREVLELSRKYNFLVLEDDPYYCIYYGNAARPDSYFALELEQPEVGRVLRFDSFSKILSAGIRIGFASGPEVLLNAMDLHTSSANLQVSTLTQVITHTVVETWGYAGFVRHTEAVSALYREKRDVFESAMRRHLDGLAEWSTPEAGMFFWFKLLLKPPSTSKQSVEEEDSEEFIRTTALENGVLAIPGTCFLPSGGKTAYVRASFSLLGADEVDEALRRLREVIIKARQA